MIPSKFDIERTVLAAARERIAALADEYRETVLLPFCRKHRLTFIAGMGRTVFYTEDGRSFGDAEEAAYEGYAAKRIFAVLDQEAVGQNDCFGFYMRNVDDVDAGLRSGGES